MDAPEKLLNFWRVESCLQLMLLTMLLNPTSSINFMQEPLLMESQGLISCWICRKQLTTWILSGEKASLFKTKSGSKATYSASPTSGKNVTVGFDGVVLRLLEMLTGEPSGQRVIPIVGMGGIGKTTLARNVYEHSFIQHHFDVCLWATISQKYSGENILKELLPTSSRSVSELGVELHKMLWRRRYLIVLDDMWSVEAWDEIQRFLPDNENGSCVIVTTRLSNLATHLSSDCFEMEFLDDDRSWELFCGKMFGEEGCPIELMEIGKKIVGRCRGLPLSITLIGGHLKRSSREIEYWEMVANLMNPISGLGEDEQCLKILSLSYENLPACLKPCFLYLGIFQEDQLIDTYQLLRLWIAEGFVKGKADLSLEEVAEDYLKDLSDRNLILVSERRWNGKVEKFVIHDIVRELCLKVAHQEKFLGVLDTSKSEVFGWERRIVVRRELSSSLQPHVVGLPSQLRSLICQQVWFIDELSVDLRLLRLSAYVNRVFSVKDDRAFPTANIQRVNLRYLIFDVYSGDLYPPNPNPSSMSVFWNMQTLIINKLTSDIYVEYDIWEMAQLRHLEFGRAQPLLDPLPRVINDQSSDQQKRIVLENIHTLLEVKNLRLTEEVCRRMPNIKNLSVYYNLPAGYKARASFYCPQNLGRLNQLVSLKFEFGDDYKWRDIVQNFVLPSSLEELSLWNCHWEDLIKMLNSLPCLGSLELRSIRGPEWVLPEEELEFPRLKILKIFRCDDLINWNANSSHFPVLENLNIWGAPELSEFPFDVGEIPTLGRIDLSKCSVSASISAMRIVVEQESFGNEDLILKVNFLEKEQVEEFQKMLQQESLTTNNLHLYYRQNKIKTF